MNPGKYRHYKGGTYTLLFEARNSTNKDPNEGEMMAVYVSHSKGTICVRPTKEFLGLNPDGVPRFSWIEE